MGKYPCGCLNFYLQFVVDRLWLHTSQELQMSWLSKHYYLQRAQRRDGCGLWAFMEWRCSGWGGSVGPSLHLAERLTQEKRQKAKETQTRAQHYLWTMSVTEDKKPSILWENISAPFLKKLIWKIQLSHSENCLGKATDKTHEMWAWQHQDGRH